MNDYPPGGGVPVYSAPAGTLNFGQVSVGTSVAVQVAGNNAQRRSLVICNSDSTNYIAIGDGNGVTTATGHIIPPGQALTLSSYNGPVYAIAHTAACVVTWVEEST